MPKHPLVFAKSVFRNVYKHINGLLVCFLYKEKKKYDTDLVFKMKIRYK